MSPTNGALHCPPELLGVIFEHTLPRIAQRTSAHSSPLLLMQVCRHWHDVAQATPSLWSSLDFGNRGSPELLARYLERCAGHPLNLTLSSHTLPLANAYAIVIRPYAAQFRSLKLQVPAQTIQSLSGLEPMPLLEQISLLVERQDLDSSSAGFHIPPNAAPRLRSVFLELPPNTLELTLPWSQITQLHSRLHTADDALRLIAKCPKLHRVSCVVTSIRTPPTISTNIVCPDLETVQASPILFPHLTLPSLRALVLGNDHIMTLARVSAEVTSLLQRSASGPSCKLASLALRIDGQPLHHLAAILHADAAGRDLTHLHLTLSHPRGIELYSDVFLEDSVLPHLEHLEIVDLGGGRKFGPLLAALGSRAGAGLKRFELTLGQRAPRAPWETDVGKRVVSEEQLQRFREIAGKGVSVRIQMTADGVQTVLDLKSTS
ncbi:hypothetical protein HMN09_01097200 [Mycena chlorophos]|uniref:F-box domain-containing protein n=1 Tax=Mycena chlorophos TaxID=658473 RepID=A0A8H6VW76_MYCCL|nr:hypothetical protein HMN09_01097200 [Mycena chlorophos]